MHGSRRARSAARLEEKQRAEANNPPPAEGQGGSRWFNWRKKGKKEGDAAEGAAAGAAGKAEGEDAVAAAQDAAQEAANEKKGGVMSKLFNR